MALPLKPKRLIQNGLVAHYAPIRQRNLLKWSEDFSNGAWSKGANTVLTGGQVDYLGGNNAFRLELPMVSTTSITQIAIPTIVGKTYTFSVWVKSASNKPQFCLYLNIDVKSILTATNEWVRYSLTFTATSTSHSLAINNYDDFFASDIYIWGAQLELSPSATTYQRTTDLQTVWNQKQENMSVTNIVTNGNFASGTSGWISDLSTISITNNIATLKATARYGGIQQAKSYTPLTHKFYARAFVRADSNLVSLRIYDNVVFATRTHSGSGNFELLSTILTCSNGNIIKVYTNDDRTSGWTDVQIKEVMMFNLTSLFGAGNEPTQQQCDEMFSSWFDGSIRMNLNRYNGMLGSTSAVDTNDPTYDGTGLSFGGDDYVGIPTTGMDNEGTICLVGKMRSLVLNTFNMFLGHQNTDNRLYLSIYQVNRNYTIGVANTIINTNILGKINSNDYLAFSWKSGIVKFYINGILVFTGVYTGTITYMPTMLIGAENSIGNAVYFSDCIINYFMSYKRALTDTEIVQNYNVIRQECARLGVILS